MAFLVFNCEHCGKKSHRFLRPSQVRGTVICPSCKKFITSGGSSAAIPTLAASGGQKISCTKCD
ncbi:MAG: hypothetical protein LBQ63_04880 [Deltaproteobacteria bacterium]|jgi:hypothetical protein|nr:hypothetical protein [Deltaproteobacteria bacterium]